MRIERAAALGMCFGVRDALGLLDDVADPTRVAIHGELVHNEQVLVQLSERGFQQSGEASRRELPTAPTVLITAHGVSDRERRRLAAAGKELLDATCPLVVRAHQAAQQLAAEGRHVIVIGRPGHVEVQGIVEDLPSYDVVAEAADVATWPHARLGIVCQTTTPRQDVVEIRAAIAARNPAADIRFLDTVCQPTKDRQVALDRLLASVDVVVVIGGRNSNNTLQLVRAARERGLRVHHIQQAADLRREWFAAADRVGLTAGTSTLPQTIDDVHARLLEFAAASAEVAQAS